MKKASNAETLNRQVKGNGIEVLNPQTKKTEGSCRIQNCIIDADLVQLERFAIQPRPCADIMEA